ncbi:methionyl-tRNA formyltransferase [Flagellimonas meridianipacifica]|uniref:Methionyl-tRNA formyltransferase n=1 Tax=Flagellimonas meridianipacifica TaxID=1080225 RepID=A0A2T0MCJ2_9FLAO|nr:methionyl-tRNA formyltransferase [Allomuricauda pacifica]PRX55211.1 methionyl-tRNA formyltransferase [Allomuricauda pacifica]
MSIALQQNESLRIVFMGTPAFAVESLKLLLEADFNVVGVITAPDRPAGRGMKVQESAVKQFAVANNLNVLQPTNLKDEQFIEELRQLKANLQVVVAFRMLPRVVWQMPEYGTFNLHASLLPQYRGAAPINWAIINGEKETGVTTFFIDDKIDTGHIIMQDKIQIEQDENAGSLHDRLMQIGGELVVKTCNMITKGEIKTIPQEQSSILKAAPKIHKETCKIDWNLPAEQIQNHIRGLSPYPGAWTHFQKTGNDNPMVLKVFKSAIEPSNQSYSIGEVITTKDTLKVAVEDGIISLLEIQLPGKKRMKTADTLRGFHIGENAKMR